MAAAAYTQVSAAFNLQRAREIKQLKDQRFMQVMLSVEKSHVQRDAALNNMLQGLCMFDKDARLVLCNDRYLEMYGLSRETVIVLSPDAGCCTGWESTQARTAASPMALSC